MTTSSSNGEASIEFAIDNVLERLSLLEGADKKALIDEYKEWLDTTEDQLNILIINHISN